MLTLLLLSLLLIGWSVFPSALSELAVVAPTRTALPLLAELTTLLAEPIRFVFDFEFKFDWISCSK
jgi:hypothetical protein